MQQLAAYIRLIGREDVRSMPWKNGGGVTHELAVFPPDAGLGGKPFQWRISIAEVASDGPFSAFPGYDRSIMVVAGNGMELAMQDGITTRIAERYRPFRFPGDAHTRCRLLDGPVNDFNVISARGEIEHHCDVISGDVHEAAWSRTSTVFVHCLNGNLIVKLRGLAEWMLGAGQSLWFTARPEGETAPILFAPHSPQSVAVVVTLRHLPSGT